MTRLTLIALAVVIYSFSASAQSPAWTDIADLRNENQKIKPASYRTVSVNFENLKDYLSQAPAIEQTPLRSSEYSIDLPNPEGGFWTFKIVEASIMEPELQARYPEIRTFSGQGTDHYRHASLRLDYTLKGFHAQVLIPGKTYYIDPYTDGDLNTYIVYSRHAFYQSTTKTMPACQPVGQHVTDTPSPGQIPMPQNEKIDFELSGESMPAMLATVGTQLRTYRLALACTGEYALYHGGTVPAAISAMTTTMNRVNGIYIRDLSLQMIMVANNDDLVYLNPATDPYSNGDGFAMLGQNQSTCNSVIGSSNYDIGHVFSTGGGGVASLSSVCSFFDKARGVSGQTSPIGDPFDVDYVSHEFGHQWGAEHTQNNSCNRSSSSAYEPGSASTIMGYAGICSPNLQSNSDDHFHNHSFNQMVTFSVNGSGNSCAQITATGNTPPSVTVPAGGFYIPVSTPFELTCDASDINGDALTYCWEQYDLGPSTSGGDNSLSNPSGNAPIFRSWSPTPNDTRVFPRLQDLLNNTTTLGEHLPTYSRDLTFRCTVRDNAAGGGGVQDAEVAFEATASAGPFLVTAPNTAVNWTGNTNQTITWNVANTNAAPVNCNNVDIFLSTDGGWTYPFELASNVPNNGSASVLIPNVPTTQARVKVKAANNIFFDISNQNFTIEQGAVNDYDVALLNINEPGAEICGTTVTPEISVANYGSETLTSFQVLYNLNGSTNTIYNWSGSLNSGLSTIVNLPALPVSAGFQSLNISLSNPNGQTDEDLSNNTGLQFFIVTEITGQPLPVTNDFQGSFPGTGWTIENPDGDLTWTSSIVSNDVDCNASTTARINFYNYNSPGETDDLISPSIDLGSASAPELLFDYAYARYSALYNDRMQVQISEGCEDTWITLWDKANLELSTAGSQSSSFNPDCGDWSSETIDLSAYAGAVVKIRFRGISGYGNNLYLDNINVTETATVDCNGVPDGSAFIDNCGDCVGGNTGEIACVQDCNGVYGGTAFTDNCGDCVGGNTGETACVQDCNGVFGGTAFTDNCGDCVGGNTGETACVQDCNGIYGGTAFTDNCGDCVGGNTGETACVQDCNGVFGGNAFLDNCGDCVGGTTGETECVQDCNGVYGGSAYEDDCGVCDDIPENDNQTCADCAGIPNGSAYLDDCGNCIDENDTPCSAILNGTVNWNSVCGERTATLRLYAHGTAVLEATYLTTLNADGTFAINDLLTGTFDVFVQVDGYLQKGMPDITITGGSNNIALGQITNGNVDNEGGINIDDLTAFLSAFGTSEGNPGFNPLADLNCDGNVNIDDLTAFLSNYGQSEDSPPL